MRLNDEQSLVVTNLDRNILLTAPAGTGKTSTLAARIKNILAARKAYANEILCLTYTNRACNEMLVRLRSFLTAEELQQICIRTMHSFSLMIVNEHPEFIQMPKDRYEVCKPQKFDEIVAGVILRDIPDVRKLATLETAVRLTEQYFDMLVEARYTSSNFESAHKDLMSDHQTASVWKFFNSGKQARSEFTPKLRDFGGKWGRELSQKLIHNRTLTFSMMALLAHHIISSPSGIQLYGKKYKYIMIDEVQDLSIQMYNTMSRMFGNAKVMLCGDSCQTIYGWRGSNPDYIVEEFRKKNPLEVEFSINYRSTMALQVLGMDVANKLLGGKNSRKVEDYLRQEPKPAADAELIVSSKNEYEFRYICEKIKEIRVQDPGASIAVLARTNQRIANMRELAKVAYRDYASGVEFGTAEDFTRMCAPIFDVLRDCMKLLTNPYRDSTAFDILSKLHILEEDELNELASLKSSVPTFSVQDFFDPTWKTEGEPFRELTDPRLDSYFVIFDTETSGLDMNSDEIIQIAAVKLNFRFEVVGKFNRLLYSNRDLTESERVHHITNTLLEECGEDRKKVLEDFLDFVGTDSVLLGHNVNFDLLMVRKDLAAVTNRVLKYSRLYDTLDIAYRMVKDAPNHKLITLVEWLHLDHESTHDAYDDVMATRDLLVHLVDNYLIPHSGESLRWYQKYMPLVRSCATTMRAIKREVDKGSSLGTIVKALLRYLVPICRSVGIEESMEASLKESERMLADMMSSVEVICEKEGNKFCGTQMTVLSAGLGLKKSEMDKMFRMTNRIPMMTVHGSKGCEYDYVFFTEVVQAAFREDRGGSYDNPYSRNEPQRVFYVGVTRPRKKLYLMAVSPDRSGVCEYVWSINENLIDIVQNPYDL